MKRLFISAILLLTAVACGNPAVAPTDIHPDLSSGVWVQVDSPFQDYDIWCIGTDRGFGPTNACVTVPVGAKLK